MDHPCNLKGDLALNKDVFKLKKLKKKYRKKNQNLLKLLKKTKSSKTISYQKRTESSAKKRKNSFNRRIKTINFIG